MSRPIRIEFPGALFHVTSRGVERRDIFMDDVDRVRFLEYLGEAVKRFGWILSSYTLMTNHFHMTLELTAETLATGMKWLNGKYGQAFNRRHYRVGPLFQGPPRTPLIEKESYMLTVLRYVVLNPVRAGMVELPEDYKWSSYRATVGLAKPPEWLSTDEVLRGFGEDRAIAIERYARFVRDGIGQPGPWADLVGDVFLGREEWVRQIRDRIEAKPRVTEHPRVQRHVGRWTMSDVVRCVRTVLGSEPTARRIRQNRSRMIAAWLGCYECLLTLPSIAAGLKLRSAGYVSGLIRDCDRQLHVDESLRKAVDACRERLYAT